MSHFKKFTKRNEHRSKFNKPYGNNKYSKNSESRSSRPGQSCPDREYLKEEEIGVTEYVSQCEGFQAVIKARFSDFQVNEINLENEIAKLTVPKIPKEFLNPQRQPEVSTCATAEQDINKMPPPSELIPDDIWEAVRKIMTISKESEIVEFDVTDLTKEDRTGIHRAVKEKLGMKIVTFTADKSDRKYIMFKKFNKGDKIDTRMAWPENFGEYVYFTVHKHLVDSMEACMTIASCLRLNPSSVTFAGTKDRRAKTTQWFCVKKVHPKLILSRMHRVQKLKIGNFSFNDTPLQLGKLAGNYFRIALRNVQATDEVIVRSVENLKQNGFLNYYGLQRFGNYKEVTTYMIGKELLLGNWKIACNLILKLKKGDDPSLDITQAKKIYSETGSAEQALKVLSHSAGKTVEGKLLEGLAKGHTNDLVNALENIPRSMRLLYIHSFQSLIWNKVASERIKKFGVKAVEGDLVLLSNEKCTSNITEDDCDETEESAEEPGRKTQVVKVLEAADLEKYTIYDVVLPLPGYDVFYPENLKDYYKQLLEEHGLCLEMPKQKVKTYNVSGDYRHLLASVEDLTWKIMYYDDPNCNLIRSDLEELEGEDEPQSIEGGKYKALIVNFKLSSSSYATMALRELLKTDTSHASQLKLNDYHKDIEQLKEEVSKNANEELSDEQTNRRLSIKRLLEEADTDGNDEKKTKISDDV